MVAGGRELIDTLWNVNDDERSGTDVHDNELIDTLWNVNVYLSCIKEPEQMN